MDRKHPDAICESCTLRGQAHVATSFAPAQGAAQLYVIGEGPGASEVNLGKPFVGQSGQLLRAVLKLHKCDDTQVTYTNVVSCRPPGNREPTDDEMLCCYPRLIGELTKVSDGAAVLAFGNAARRALAAQLSGGITTLAGLWHFDEASKRWITFCIHPAAVLRSPSERGRLFMDTIGRALKGPVQVDVETVKHYVASNWEGVANICERLADYPEVVYDLETDQIDWREDRILCIGFAPTPTLAYIVPGPLLYGDGKPFVGRLLENPDVTFIGHNGKFDVKFLRHQVGINARMDFDTMVAHLVVNELKGTHGLKVLAQHYFGLPDYEKDLVQIHLKSRNDFYSKVPEKDLYRYCALDVAMNFRLYRALKAELIENDLYDEPFLVPMMESMEMLTHAEMTGMPINEDYVLEQLDVFGATVEVLLKGMRKQGKNATLNANSPQQVARVMYDTLKMPIVTGRDVKARSTSKGAVILLEEHPNVRNNEEQLAFLHLLKRHRRVAKLRSSYLLNLLERSTSASRVHPTIMIHGTEMGRLAVRNPALQTIPRSDPREIEEMGADYGTRIKTLFQAPPGRVLLECDYSQAELRVFAALTKEPFLLQVYEDDRDLHTEVALGMYGEDFTSTNRAHCKMFNFSYLYGGNDYSFALDTGIPIAMAKRFVQDYNRLMPRAAEWKSEVVAEARRMGYVSSLFGRRRRFPIITGENLAEVRKGSIHFLVASVATDLTLRAASMLCDQFPDGADVIMLVHDSVIAECGEDQVPLVAQLMEDTLLDVARHHVPGVTWKAGVKVGKSWATLEAYDGP